MADTKNYTLGRGKLHFSRFKTGTYTPEGYRYIGNTPAFSLNIQATNLDHYNSDEGIREKDDSVALETNRGGSFMTDNIVPENVALFFFGESQTITQTIVASAPETLRGVILGHSYRLGVTPTNPAGYFGINSTGFLVKKALVTAVVDVDYTMDYEAGVLTILSTSTLFTSGDDAIVTYAVKASTRERVISGSEAVEGAVMFVTKNAKGTDSVYVLPWVRITPNGDYALKGDTWQEIPMTLEILKLPLAEAIYRDGLPAYA